MKDKYKTLVSDTAIFALGNLYHLTIKLIYRMKFIDKINTIFSVTVIYHIYEYS